MIHQQETHLGAVAVGVTLPRRIYPAHRGCGLLPKRLKDSLIQNGYPPAVRPRFLGRKKLPVPLPQGIRQLFKKGLVVDRLALKDFLEVVVQWLTCCRLGKLAEKFTTRGRLCP